MTIFFNYVTTFRSWKIWSCS